MSKSMRTKNSVLNFITGIGGQLLTTVLKFVTRTVFINVLGKSYLGINGLFSDILMMLSLTELGLDTAMNFKLYKPLAEKDVKRIRVLMRFYKHAYRLIGLAILLLGLCFAQGLHLLIKDYESLEALGINAVLIFMLHLFQTVSSYFFFAYRSAIVKADQKEYIINIANYIIIILSNTVQIIILLVWKNFVIYTASVVAFNIITNCVNAFIAQKMYPKVFIPENDNLSKKEIKDTLKDCGALFLYKVNFVVLKGTDNLVLSKFIGLAMVGVYSNYLLIYTTINSFLNRFYSSTKASIGNLFAVSDVKKQYQFFETMNFISIIIYGTACVGISVVSNELIQCWVGNDYIIAQPLAILIGVEILFAGIKNNLSQVRNVSGVFKQMWFRPLLGIIVNLGVSIALVQIIGIYGIIVGTICADLFTNFLLDPILIHRYSFNNYKPVCEYYKKNYIYILILFVVEAVDMFLCSIIMPGHGWISFILHTVICGISVPTVFLVIFHKTPECKYLLEKIKHLKKQLNNKA